MEIFLAELLAKKGSLNLSRILVLLVSIKIIRHKKKNSIIPEVAQFIQTFGKGNFLFFQLKEDLELLAKCVAILWIPACQL